MIGMIPALFGDDEKDAIINAVRNESLEAGYGVAKWDIDYLKINLETYITIHNIIIILKEYLKPPGI